MTRFRILLVEPGYRNKYPPLGLMKLAAYHHERGDFVRLVKGEDRQALHEVWDRVYVTTLFSFEWKRTAQAIDFAIRAAGNQSERVFVGGIAASLMLQEFINEPRWAGVRFIAGLLDGPPAQALSLSAADGDFGAEDIIGVPIEEQTPDYSILEHIDYTYPVHDAYFGYASRGCIRKCHFCGVPKLEGTQREMPSLTGLVRDIVDRHGEKKDLILMDNNVTASSRYREIIAEIRELGFTPGATLTRDRRSVKRRVDFNQGVDARILAKSPVYLREMATICVSPLRIAFDHIGVRKVYETSVRMAADNGITSLSNYMLYNFMDTPQDLYERLALNIRLNDELGVRIWSFPMRYQPVTLKDRSHVGQRWNRYYLRTFQVILQATHGMVSGNPAFFHRAFGKNNEEFMRLLSYPPGMIFHREYFESGDGQPVKEAYDALRQRLSKRQEEELMSHLAEPTGGEKARADYYLRIAGSRDVDAQVREVIRYHALGTKDTGVIDKQRVMTLFPRLNPDPVLPDAEEMVEDAGLFEQEDSGQSSTAGHNTPAPGKQSAGL